MREITTISSGTSADIETAETSLRQALKYPTDTPFKRNMRTTNIKQLNAWLAQARNEGAGT